MHASLVAESNTHEFHPLNSSDHLPLSVHLSIPALCNSLTTNSITAYVAAIEETVRPLLAKPYSQPSDIDEEIKLVSSCISLAASSFLPTMKAKSKKKKRILNNPLLRDLSFKSKAAWKKLCVAGRPGSGLEYEEKKRLKKLTHQCADNSRAGLERLSW